MSTLKANDAVLDDLVHVNRVTKVVKGGRNFSFAAIVVAGDAKGRVGYGTGKAKEVVSARSKASKSARLNMLFIPLYKGRTIHHDVIGKSGASKVLLRRAPAGTGVIAGGALRAVFDRLGIQDIVAKSLGSTNPNSVIRATFSALRALRSYNSIATRRSKSLSQIFDSV